MPEQPTNIGRYLIRSVLGHGGMGSVYLAFDPQLERAVAIKLLRVRNSEELSSRFAREARVAARLRHPHIITIYELGETEGQPFIAMEYVEGETLAEMIRRGEPRLLSQKLQIAEEIADAVAHAHRQGLIHRDLKPANVIIDREGGVKILDFGIARMVEGSSLTSEGALMGTPSYMSPEQLRGEVLDHRSDIFSVGATLYELLTAKKAFPGEIHSALQKILNEDPPPLSASLPGVSPDVEAIVERALRKRPEERYADLTEMRADLKRARTRLRSPEDPEAAVRAVASVAEAPAATPTRWEEERRVAMATVARASARLAAGELRDAAELLSTIETADPSVTARVSDVRSVIAFSASQLDRQQELHDVVERAVDKAEGYLGSGALDPAEAALKEVLTYSPSHPRALHLQEELHARRRQADRDVRSGANRSDEAGDLSAASHDTVVSLDPTIAAAGPASPTIRPVEEAPPAESTIVFPGRPDTRPAKDRPALEARLVVIQSGDPRLASKSFDLDPLPFSIGRAEQSNVRSQDPMWSRRHAVVELRDRGLFVRDFGSVNGVFVDGRRVPAESAEPLFFGAQITIGGTTFRLVPVQDTALPDLTGVEIAGRYTLESLLRESAQGALYVARLTTLPRRVAVKLLSPALLRYPGYQQRFRRRAEVTAQLQHPHICRVMDHGDARISDAGGGIIETEYLCLDLMTGGSLTDRLEATTPIPLTSVHRWIQLIAEALSYAHGMKVVHGDLKPSAIVFDEDENPYVTDFALGQHRTTDLIGTPAYMAPEQWASGEIGPATDQFGLAVLAYYMIAGARPFEGQDHPDIRRRNFARGPIPVHEEARVSRAEAIPADVSDVVARGLSIEAERRYPSILAFAADLGRALRGGPRAAEADRAPRVFFSYRRGPAAGWAVHIASQLRERHGVDVFLDVQGIDTAVKFPDRLTRAIDAADVFVCLLGPTTLDSAWVRQEIERAYERHKPMIPIFQENYEVPEGKEVATPSLDALFSYDGVRLLDDQNLYVEYMVLQLADRIKNTVRRV